MSRPLKRPPAHRPVPWVSYSTHRRKKSVEVHPHQREQVAQLCQLLGILFVSMSFGFLKDTGPGFCHCTGGGKNLFSPRP